MLRRFLLLILFIAAISAACSDDGPSAGDFDLTTDATLYQRISGVPAPPLTLTLHNRSSVDGSIDVCNQEGTPTAIIRYQQLQPDESWAGVSFGTVTCDAPAAPVIVAAGATWIVPPESQAFPLESGTYRIVLTVEAPDELTVVSNSFVVDSDFEPTS